MGDATKHEGAIVPLALAIVRLSDLARRVGQSVLADDVLALIQPIVKDHRPSDAPEPAGAPPAPAAPTLAGEGEEATTEAMAREGMRSLADVISAIENPCYSTQAGLMLAESINNWIYAELQPDPKPAGRPNYLNSLNAAVRLVGELWLNDGVFSAVRSACTWAELEGREASPSTLARGVIRCLLQYMIAPEKWAKAEPIEAAPLAEHDGVYVERP